MGMLYDIEVGGEATRMTPAYDGCEFECATMNRAVGVVDNQCTMKICENSGRVIVHYHQACIVQFCIDELSIPSSSRWITSWSKLCH